MKKFLALGLASVMVAASVATLAVAGCADNRDKFGLIALHDNNSTYDANFISAFKKACKNKGVKAVIKTGIPEDDKCYNAAASLAESGCKAVFADSFGHESHIIRAAKQFTDVQFCHATGVSAASENLPNFHNAFASIYEGRYLAGVAGGEALKAQLGANYNASTTYKLGYVGAYTYAEVISGYTSWFLGVQSVIPNVEMDVKFTGSWFAPDLEKSAAEDLINGGAIMISQHADSMGAPTACQTKSVLNVSYNGLTGLSTNVASSKINWTPYFEYMIESTLNGTAIDTNKTGTIDDGSVVVDLGTGAAATTAAKLADLKAQLKAGTLQVFDTSKFTVGGQAVTTKTVNGQEAIKTAGGITYFAESLYQSAPYFDLRIDGINLLNEEF